MKTKIALVLFAALGLAGCEQALVKAGGSSMTVNLPCGQALENVTWKADGDLWHHTRPFLDGEIPTTHTFKAKSIHGVLEGEVKLVESFCK